MKRLAVAAALALLLVAPACAQVDSRIRWDWIQPDAEVDSIECGTAVFTGDVTAATLGTPNGGMLYFLNADAAPAMDGFYLTDDGNPVAWLSSEKGARLAGDLRVAGDIYLATEAGSGNAYLYFEPDESKYLRWTPSTGRFFLADDLYVYGYVEIKDILATWGEYLEIRSATSQTQGIRFYSSWVGGASESIEWNPGESSFVFSDDILTEDVVRAEDLLAADDVYINYDLSAGASYLKFGNGVGFSNYLGYDPSTDTFTLTGHLLVDGEVTASTIVASATDLTGDNLALAGWLNVSGTAALTTVDAQRVNAVGAGLNGGFILFSDSDSDYTIDGLRIGDDGSPKIYFSGEKGWWMTQAPLTVDATAEFNGTVAITKEMSGALALGDNLYVAQDITVGTDTADAFIYFITPSGTKYLNYNQAATLFSLSDDLQVNGGVSAIGNVLASGGDVKTDLGDFKFSTIRSSYIHEKNHPGGDDDIALVVEGAEVVEWASNAVYINKPIYADEMHCQTMSGGILMLQNDDGEIFTDGVFFQDDAKTILALTNEFGAVLNSECLTVEGATTTLEDVTVTNNLEVQGVAELSGNASVGGTLDVTGVSTFSTIDLIRANAVGAALNGGFIYFSDYDSNYTLDGIRIGDDGAPEIYYSSEKGWWMTGAPLTVSATASLAGTAALACATNAWQYTCSAPEIASWGCWDATKNAAVGYLSHAYSQIYAGSCAIPIKAPDVLENATHVLTKIWISGIDQNTGAYIDDVRIVEVDSQTGVATQVSYHSGDIGSGAGTGTYREQVLPSSLEMKRDSNIYYLALLDMKANGSLVTDNTVRYFDGMRVGSIRYTGTTVHD